jgi:hypothetical protein
MMAIEAALAVIAIMELNIFTFDLTLGTFPVLIFFFLLIGEIEVVNRPPKSNVLARPATDLVTGWGCMH